MSAFDYIICVTLGPLWTMLLTSGRDMHQGLLLHLLLSIVEMNFKTLGQRKQILQEFEADKIFFLHVIRTSFYRSDEMQKGN